MLLGQSLGKQIVAEGIETASQFVQLRDLGCTIGQGYHLGRPLSAPHAGNLVAGGDEPLLVGLPPPSLQTETGFGQILH